MLRAPSNHESLFPARVIYDMFFFFVVIIIVLNLIFGVIIDTFADLRSEKQQKEEVIKNSCFICGKLILAKSSQTKEGQTLNDYSLFVFGFGCNNDYDFQLGIKSYFVKGS